MTKTIILIPSRMSAKRLPGKPLLKINNLPIISHVFNKAKKTSIGRVVVSKKNRGKDLGKKIMIDSIEYIKQNIKGEKIELSAQKYLDKFYKDLGFYKIGEDYLEDGIPHQRMLFELV